MTRRMTWRHISVCVARAKLCTTVFLWFSVYYHISYVVYIYFQLTSLFSEVGLNIQEAHVFSTIDGYSLDVFVVDGWAYEVSLPFTDKMHFVSGFTLVKLSCVVDMLSMCKKNNLRKLTSSSVS